MELINKIRKSRKGFTLVEIIVVLVILAILAAFTIPTMLGFVGDAKGKSYIAEAREVYVAAQATATEMTAKGGLTPSQLQTALGSGAVKAVKLTPPVGSPSLEQSASMQMWSYLKGDLNAVEQEDSTYNTTDGLNRGYAYWAITLSASDSSSLVSTTNKAKVTTLVYSKGGYQVTIKDGNASVKKLN
ncbi:type II secretion system protein [Acetobacterium sp. K1/6]|jgi:prepilin-type N-terminal cleavage/methylation domain|uniref:type II secretion system protein n=1 Tax=Acetobacterium sp. K1/6 TaxID=3055467 RepID=UPI002ACA133D|nr:type II secretion system protein [Acetobacterium sp. K1/6]MDZ5724357.1 type II secretion system protein [Acetobacterium sp. K1/6]